MLCGLSDPDAGGASVLGSLLAAGMVALAHPDGGYVVDAGPEEVGRAALAGGVALTHLAPAEAAGLEQLFFDLTAA
jgi:ABC-2 type transport system ATP-binding protein